MPAKKLILAFAAAFMLQAAPARADWMNGNQLQDMCASTSGIDRGLCLSYIMGVLDGARFLDRPLKSPTDATGGQVRDVVAKYLAVHPESRAQPARLIIKAAVVEAWPELQGSVKEKAKAKAKPKGKNKKH